MGLRLIKIVVKVVAIGIFLNFAHCVPLVAEDDGKLLISDDVDNSLGVNEGRQISIPLPHLPVPWNSCVPESSMMHNVPGASLFYQTCSPPTECVPLTASTSPSIFQIGYGLLGTCRYKDSTANIRETLTVDESKGEDDDAMQAVERSLVSAGGDHDAKDEAKATPIITM